LRLLRDASEEEMIAVFLRGELASDRWSETLRGLLARDGRGDQVLTQPDLADPEENRYRSGILEDHRAWERRDGLFGGFPRDVEWFRAELEPDEVLDVLFIHWDWWLTVSGGTRRPREAARRIRAGELDGVTAAEHEPLAAALRSSPPPPELIVVTTPAQAPLVLLEGHFRLTAYALFPEYLPPRLEALLGVSEEMPRWCMFQPATA
jgi:hypothetical protein